MELPILENDFRYWPLGTTFVIFVDPISKQLTAVETTAWEITYDPAADNKHKSLKVGGYTTEWHYVEIGKTNGSVSMRGRCERRLWLEHDKMMREQLPEPARDEFDRQLAAMRKNYKTAECEIDLSADEIKRRNWYGKKLGKAENESVYVRRSVR
jgi:hypothetical protein